MTPRNVQWGVLTRLSLGAASSRELARQLNRMEVEHVAKACRRLARRRLVRAIGYEYSGRAGRPPVRYELTHAGRALIAEVLSWSS